MMLLWLATSCAGKSSQGQPGGAHFEVMSEGSGVTNDEPLLPLFYGARYTWGPYESWVDVVEGEPHLFRLHTLYRLSKEEESETVWMSQTDDGVLLHWSAEDGHIDRPMLIVPKSVRVGMRWRVWVDDDDEADYEFEVLSREVKETMWGTRPIWEIERVWLHGEQQAVSDYVEGRGRGTWTAAVLPVDRAEPPARREPEPLSLTLLMEGERELDMWLRTLSAVMEEGRPPRVLFQGWRPPVTPMRPPDYPVSCWEYAEMELTRAPEVQGDPRIEIQQNEGCLVPYEDELYTSYGDGSGVLVTDDGARWIPRLDAGRIADHGRYLALYHDRDGRARAIEQREHDFQLDDMAGADAEMLFGSFEVLEPRVETHVWNGGMRRVWALWSEGADPWLLFQGATGLMSLSKQVGNTFTVPLTLGVVGDRFHTSVSRNGTEIYVTQQGGLVQRIRRDDDELKVEAVGIVPLDDGENLAGAVRVGDELLIAVGFVADGPKLRIYKAALRGSLSDRDMAWMAGVTMRAVGPDVEVCWPPTDAPLSEDGWTIAGRAPAAVVGSAGRPCALLIRDVADAEPLGRPDRYLVEGDIPGVGRRILAFALSEAHAAEAVTPVSSMLSDWVEADVPLAALEEGGLATPTALYDVGGRFVGRPSYAGELLQQVVDARGAGIWIVTSRSDGARVITLQGTRSFEYLVEDGTPSQLLGSPPDVGGVVFGAAGSWRHLTKSGEVVSISGGTQSGTVVGAGPRVCTRGASTIECGDDADRVSFTPPEGTTTLYGLRDGSFIAQAPADEPQASRLVRIDVSAGTAEEYAEDLRVHALSGPFSYDAHGDLWVPVMAAGEDAKFIGAARLDPSGPIVVPMPDASQIFGGREDGPELIPISATFDRELIVMRVRLGRALQSPTAFVRIPWQSP